jgi:hypothetical protein
VQLRLSQVADASSSAVTGTDVIITTVFWARSNSADIAASINEKTASGGQIGLVFVRQ